jgi:hypothetical protein
LAGCTGLGAGIEQACNDGIVQSPEVCDDGNASCGTCSPGCTAFASDFAKGSISVLKQSNLVNGDNFTLADGYGNSQTFEYRTSGTQTAGRVLILINSGGSGDSASTVRTKTVSAVNFASTLTSASVTTGTATFTTTANPHPLSAGVKVLVSGVSVAGYNGTWTIATVTANTFTVTGMPALAAGTGGTVDLALDITAVAGTSPLVTLNNDRYSVFGNNPPASITLSVADSDFTKVEFAGGLGGDCATGGACRIDEDCKSNVCTGNTSCQ